MEAILKFVNHGRKKHGKELDEHMHDGNTWHALLKQKYKCSSLHACSQEKAEPPNKTSDNTIQQGGDGHPTMSYFSDNNNAPTVVETEIIVPRHFLFLPV